jgi:hypothetical protein
MGLSPRRMQRFFQSGAILTKGLPQAIGPPKTWQPCDLIRSARNNKMKNQYFPIPALALMLFLSACSSLSPAAGLQTAVAGTQTALPTQTAYPTYTPLPPTPYPTKIPYNKSFSIRLYPGVEASLIYASETGTEIWLDFPKDATLQPARAMFMPELASIYPPSLVYNGDAFVLLTGLGDQMEGFKGFTYHAPVSVTIKFAVPQDLATLALYTWTGSDWGKVETVCNLPMPIMDPGANTIKTSICSPGAFAIFARKGD